jgi:HAE1 family hydrophobic/amphiphilic exporter-1
MVALYDSFVYPFVVLFSIPVAAIGAFFRIEFVVKQSEFIRLIGFNYANGLSGKKRYSNCGFYQSIKSRRQTFLKKP